MVEENRQDVPRGRIAKLGFKPQKEVIYNKFLPYANQLDEESLRTFAEIKANLGKSVLMREMRPGCGIWSARLSKYIKLYGLKFSKEDHIALIHLMYELVVIPHLEPWLVSKFAQVLIMLLKKKEVLSPDELSLPWRPLYVLCKRIMSTSRGAIGMYRYFSSLEVTLDSLVHAARFYFPASATQEMLDTWRPLLCPFDSGTMLITIETMEWFLPIALPQEQSEMGYKLWFEELMHLWEVCHNAPNWEAEMMWLMARLARYNIGYIDWEPYIPLMFTRFLRSLNLPVAYKQMQTAKHHKLETSAMALWIVSVLGGKSSAQKYLDKFMKALESYFHPANFGRWIMKLGELLGKLPLYFVQRLHSERFKKLTWETPVPDSHKLTEDDITSFVESIKPVALQAMFSKMGTEVGQAMQHLATLRPNIIIPLIVERMYANLETLTEPHKLTAAMQCMVAVARPLVEGSRSGYKEGPTHIIPLLIAMLPGIDPNDIRKCFVTFHFISTFVTMMPIVDSSRASEHWKDMTEEEETICLATANLEDFVLQFLDRCFVLIESSSLEATRLERDADKRSKIENMAESALSSICTALLTQTSPQIFKSALRKLHSFVTGRILETKVAGHFMATMCRSFAKVHSEDTLRTLLPHLCGTILSLTESEDILKEEILDNELLYNLLIVSEIVDCPGVYLLPHVPLLLKVLDRTLHLACREGHSAASRLLSHLLGGLTSVVPLEYRSSPEPFDRPVQDYLPIKDWGIPGNIHNLKLQWHIPGKDEVLCVQQIVSKYLPPEIERINKHVNGEETMMREELQRCLSIIIGVLGCRLLLPLWDEPAIKLIDSCLPITPFTLTAGFENGFITMPDGSNVRKTLAEVMDRLQQKLLSCTEDDTKSFFNLITIWEYLLLNNCGRGHFEVHWKRFRVVKKVLENKLIGEKKHLRALLIDRAVLQHESLLERSSVCLTSTHRLIMFNLLTLSTSHYSEVRSRAQIKLCSALDNFPYSYTLLVPKLKEFLKQNSNETHEQFKGSLYVLLGPKQNPVVTRHDWDMLNTLWPAIIQSMPSEKLSVIRLLESMVESVHKHFPTITISLEIPESCLEAAHKLWNFVPIPNLDVVSKDDIALGLKQLEQRNKYNLEQYLGLLKAVLDAIEHGNLHWRYHSMAMSFLRDLVHPDVAYPAGIVRYFLKTLIHDSIELRKIAIRSTVFLLKQQKRTHKTVQVDPYSFSEELNLASQQLRPGDRPDNQWVQYNSKSRPLNAADWDKPRYLHQPYHGFYSWPKELKIYSPSSEQPSLDRAHEDLRPEEKEVDLFFSNQHNVDKLVNYLSLEERKGKDKFNGYRFILFKGLFRNHGDTHLKYFSLHLKRLVADKQESSQRCAAEIIAGLIRGAKHWPFEKVESMWTFLNPIVKTALANMTVETVADWGVCFATASESRDPNRHHWLLEILMENPLRDEASFIECGRLYTLQGALNQQEWRVAELFNRLLEYFKPYLTHPFQNVRERLGSVIINIFEADIIFSGGNPSRGPHISDFVASVIPQLAILYKVGPKTMDQFTNHVHLKGTVSIKESNQFLKTVDDTTVIMEDVNINDDEKDVAIRLLKTVCRWISGSVSRSQFGVVPDYYQFFPLACLLESYDADEELSKSCILLLVSLGQTITLPQHVPVALATVNEVSRSTSWQTRSACLEFLQVLVFHNMPIVLSNQDWISQVSSIVLQLLEDEWLEVREKAAGVLGGLLHCDFIDATQHLLEEFKMKSRTKILKKKGQTVDPASIATVKMRHSGILGLCAFINACPYDVPEYVPDVFLILGDHLNDPQPIPSTIRKTLGDFKRTHHDNWQQHSLKFTEEQLAVLGDLVIPPTYYA